MKMERKAIVMEFNRQKIGKGKGYGSNNVLLKVQNEKPPSTVSLDSDAPELVLFLQESKYHFVADISMDADYSESIPENNSCSQQRLMLKRTKWKRKSNGSSSTLSLDLDGDSQQKKQMEIHQEEPYSHHSKKAVHREAVSGSSSMGGSSMEEKGYTEASSTYWSDSLVTISSRKGRSRSSSDEIRFSDFSASFWGPVRRSAGTRAFSGDVSLSSNSSNASAHSFAFPVLPVEWNGSPVRMAVADPRQLKKQRSWKTSLLCCRF